MRPLTLLLVAALLSSAQGASAQAGTAGPGAGAATVTGTVYDSLGWRPLPGARVQLVSATRNPDLVRAATTDAGGAFTLGTVPPGRYVLGFLHPVTDSLGIEPPLRRVTVSGSGEITVNLSVPPANRLRIAVCGEQGDTGQALVMGVVRRANSREPVAKAIVDAAWLEYGLGEERISRRLGRAGDTTGANGWYALCGVPRGGIVSVRAALGADSTALVDVEVPSHDAFLRRDLYVGSAQRANGTAVSWAGNPDTPDPLDGTTTGGDHTLRGWVLTDPRGEPIAGASVSVAGGIATRTNEYGAWTLDHVPAGTRTIEVRALGYHPARLAVDVLRGVDTVTVLLPGFDHVLDTVRVAATRFRVNDSGFEQRLRSGTGRYVTGDDFARLGLTSTSDVFRTVPGFQVDRTASGETTVTMRGPFGRCEPAVFVDGHQMQGLKAEDIDAFVNPAEVAAIEVYSSAMIPAEFQPSGMLGCGSVVLWTKNVSNPASRWTFLRRFLHGFAALTLGLGVGLVVSGM